MKIAIIGGGISGLSATYFLASHGIESILIERKTLGAETTTKCAGMLHSGARYAINDIEAAKSCSKAEKDLVSFAPFAIAKEKGLFIILKDDPSLFKKQFIDGCQIANITIEELDRKEIYKLESGVGNNVKGGFLTPDRVLNPFVLIDAFRKAFQALPVEVLENHHFVKAEEQRNKWSIVMNSKNTDVSISADGIINAGGPWAQEVAKACGIPLKLSFIHGLMVVFKHKLVNRVVTRCAPNQIGDVVIPTGRVCMAGSTWHVRDTNRAVRISDEDIKQVRDTATLMIPVIKSEKVIREFTGVRAHLSTISHADYNRNSRISRNFAIISHIDWSYPFFYTVLSGKLTLGVNTGKKVACMILKRYGLSVNTKVFSKPLPAPKTGVKKHIGLN